MATHRKPRPRALTVPGPRAAVGLTTAALATVTLFGESASAAPASPDKPSITEVKAQVDKLFHQAEAATERYNGAKEQTERQRTRADALLDQVARKTETLNSARRTIGEYAAAQYRGGGLDGTTTFLLTSDPQQFLDQAHLMDRLSDRQEHALETFRSEQAETAAKRSEAVESLQKLTEAQQRLNAEKTAVKQKLAAAQKLLNSLTAQEKARLAALEKKRQEEAAEKAAEIAAKEKAAQEAAAKESGSSAGSSGSTAPASGTYAAKAAKAIEFARAQLGKPYVYGATGPNSYDCSGLTQAAWGAAGVSIPRVTYDQVDFGSRVSADQLQPGDLVFFYSDITHVGLYIGGGQMIHAPHTGSVVKIAPITEMPIYGYARMA
ncbi:MULTISPECIES: C40 family peptidase [Streptomycetaceae]|uniref:C40 family peptidase n=1 Tax=Streptomycetaceae TaxID=2062 RepID=UPI00036EFC03|nr:MULTISPECIES: C40 family peptidase [Streptomycetaceae]MYX35221.1 glycoside hydrolase [Streptomyces sp. SID8377]